MNQIQQSMKDPEYVEHNQTRIWIEESCTLGDLVFAGLDMPWQEFYQKAQSLLQQFSGCAISVNAELLDQTDWRNYQPRNQLNPLLPRRKNADRFSAGSPKRRKRRTLRNLSRNRNNRAAASGRHWSIRSRLFIIS